MTWRVQLTEPARQDFRLALAWSLRRFGPRQAKRYRSVLRLAVAELRNGPDVPGARRRGELRPELYALHVARGRRRGSHILIYRVLPGDVIEVVRILHEHMDLARHVGGSEEHDPS